ncbi:hypothetical protein SPETJ133_14920 [Staphylococcus petrasii]
MNEITRYLALTNINVKSIENNEDQLIINVNQKMSSFLASFLSQKISDLINDYD